jgi:hypothetical protein
MLNIFKKLFKKEDLQQKYQNQLSKIFADNLIKSYNDGHKHLEFNIIYDTLAGCDNYYVVDNVVYFYNESGDFAISQYLEELIIAMFSNKHYNVSSSLDGSCVKITIKYL